MGAASAVTAVVAGAVLLLTGGVARPVDRFGSPSGGAGGSVGGAGTTGEVAPNPPARRTADDPGPAATVVQRGDGTFRPAGGGSDRSGTGRLLRYRVEVEQGIGQDPQDFASWVDRVLADPRGWAARGERSFRRVSGGDVDFVVRLASPDTVDQICGRHGLDTFNEVSCRGGQDVVINLRRWLLAVPSFDGDVPTYRHAVVNHEVGHFLGYDHEQCPGEGELMPVMGTPYYGLDGCRRNGWPYPDR